MQHPITSNKTIQKTRPKPPKNRFRIKKTPIFFEKKMKKQIHRFYFTVEKLLIG